MQRTPIMKKCSTCYGFGYIRTVVSRYEWNHLSKRNDLKFINQTRTCIRCSGKGQEIDQQAQKQYKEKLRIAIEKQKKFQQYKDKQKKFQEYTKQYQINKPLLENIDEQNQQNYPHVDSYIQRSSFLSTSSQKIMVQCSGCSGNGYKMKYPSNQFTVCPNCNGSKQVMLNQKQQKKYRNSQKGKNQKRVKKQQRNQVSYENPRVKSQAQLRAQFEKKYAEQQLQAKRIQSQRKRQQEERKRAQKIETQQKQRQEKLKWEKQWQERKKTPQGMKQWQRIQNEIKWDDRKQLCCDCLKCAVKIICCGSPSCGRVISWGVVILIIVIWIVIWNWAPGSRS